MKLQKYLTILPLVWATHSFAQTDDTTQNSSVFHFSTQVSRTVEKDLMQAEIYSRKSGKNLGELKKTVSANLNNVLEQAKKSNDIEINTERITNSPDYNEKGKVIGWVAEGRIQLKSKNFEAIANILENMGEQIAIENIDFTVSPEKIVSLEDEMTLDIIKQFQHKADVIQKGLNAKKYTLSDIRLDTPNSSIGNYQPRTMYAMANSKMKVKGESLPMEAGKETISATASGKVKFEE